MSQPNSPLSLGPISRKDYTGQYVVVHTVQQGQSLAQIAADYRFKRWEPIWIYNTEIEKTLGNDPALVQRGVSIFIPRDAAGYDQLISKIEQCKLGLEFATDEIGIELEKMENEYNAMKVGWDVGGDIATLLVTYPIMALRAAKAAATAKAVVGQAKIAAHLSARATTKRFAEDYASIRNKWTQKALDKNKQAVKTRSQHTDFLKGKAVDAAAEVGDNTINRFTGREDEHLKHSKNVHALYDLRDSVRNRKISQSDAAIDLLGILLDYVSVSTVCEICVFGWGGSFEESNKQIVKNAVGTNAAMAARFDQKIQRLTEEKKRLYG
jgi:hypothetical protein